MTYFSVMKEGKFGAINQYGEEVIPFIYDELSPFTKDWVARASDLDGTHLININNEKLVTHDNISYVEVINLFHSITPERPHYFQAIKDMEKLIYNSRGELVLTLDNVNHQGIFIRDENVRIFIDDRVYIFDASEPRIDLIESYDQILKFHQKDGYIAKKNNTYSFLDKEYVVLNTIDVQDGLMFDNGNIVIHIDGNTSYAYTYEGMAIGNPNGYNGHILSSNEEYIIYESWTQQKVGLDYYNGLELAESKYRSYVVGSHLFAGVNEDSVADFFEHSQKLFSLNDYLGVSSFLKADVNLYVVSYGRGEFGQSLGEHYVDQNGNIVSGNYKAASAFNKHKIAHIINENYESYLINRNFEVMSSKYSRIIYNEDKDVFIAYDYNEDNETNVYILDGQGNSFFSLTGNLHVLKDWIVLLDGNDLYNPIFLNMYYIKNNRQVIEAKDVTYDMILTFNTMNLAESLHINVSEYLTSQLFKITTKDQPFQYEYILYDGYYVFSQGDKYIIMTHDFNQVGLEMYDDIARMPTYNSLF